MFYVCLRRPKGTICEADMPQCEHKEILFRFGLSSYPVLKALMRMCVYHFLFASASNMGFDSAERLMVHFLFIVVLRFE